MQFFSLAATTLLAVSAVASPVQVQRDVDLSSLIATAGSALGVDMTKIQGGVAELNKLANGLGGQAGSKAASNAGASATGAHSVKPTITTAKATSTHAVAAAKATGASGNDLDTRGRGSSFIKNTGDLVDIANSLSQLFGGL